MLRGGLGWQLLLCKKIIQEKEEVEKEMSEWEIEKAIEELRKERRLRRRKEDERPDWIGHQEPPRKKKKRWNVEFGRKRLKPDDYEPKEVESNKRRKTEISTEINQNERIEIYENQEGKEMADEVVCDNISSKKGVTTENECLLQQISCSKYTNEKPSIIQLFEKLNKKSDFKNQGSNSEIHIFSGKKIESNFPLNAGSGFRRGERKSENKANQQISPKLPTTHQPKKNRSYRSTKRPSFNYKPINHHFKTNPTQNESKKAGNSVEQQILRENSA